MSFCLDSFLSKILDGMTDFFVFMSFCLKLLDEVAFSAELFLDVFEGGDFCFSFLNC